MGNRLNTDAAAFAKAAQGLGITMQIAARSMSDLIYETTKKDLDVLIDETKKDLLFNVRVDVTTRSNPRRPQHRSIRNDVRPILERWLRRKAQRSGLELVGDIEFTMSDGFSMAPRVLSYSAEAAARPIAAPPPPSAEEEFVVLHLPQRGE